MRSITTPAMIKQIFGKTLAQLTDHSVCVWPSDNPEEIPTIKHANAKMFAASSFYYEGYISDIILSRDNQWFAQLRTNHDQEDISDVFQKLLETSAADTVRAIHCHSTVVVIITDYSVYSITFYPKYEKCPGNSRGISSFITCLGARMTTDGLTFDSPIDLYAFDKAHAFVRNTDGELYYFGSGHQRVTKLNMPDANQIRHIVSEHISIIMLMEDSTIRIYGWAYGPDMSKPRAQLKIDANIIKMVTHGPILMCLTDEGDCWYYDHVSRANRPQKVNIARSQEPAKLNPYTFVEQVYILEADIIFQCDGPRLCRINYGSRRDPFYSGSKLNLPINQPPHVVIPMPFFDGMVVVSITSSRFYTYFVTDQGHVYYTRDFSWFKPMPFFETNPIAINRGTKVLRSAGSALNDE